MQKLCGIRQATRVEVVERCPYGGAMVSLSMLQQTAKFMVWGGRVEREVGMSDGMNE